MKNSGFVSVSGGNGPYRNTADAVARLDLSVLKDRKVLVKPNAGRMVRPERGINTHPQAIAAVIDAVKGAGAGHIAVGESPILGVDTMEAFRLSGIADVAEERNVPLIDMDARKPVKKGVVQGRVLRSLRFCADIFDFDFIISVPVAKSHMHTQVTLGIKNMKGCLYRNEKVRLHQLEYKDGRSFPEKTLDSAISDLATVLLPDLTVIDGFIGMEGLGPSAGEAIQSDFAVASFNPLAADTVCCELMGLDRDEVAHLRLVKERGLCSLDDLRVVPDDYTRFARPYKRPPAKLDIAFPNVVVYDEDSCSACLSTTLLFLKRFASELGDYALADGKVHVGIGKDISDFPEGTILIGNCTHRHRSRGTFVPGCPPVSSAIYKAITGIDPEVNEPDIV